MGWMGLAALAWLLGVVWQTSETHLHAVQVYRWAALFSASGLVAGLMLSARWPRATRWGQVVSRVMVVASCLMLAWSSTGWRASVRMQAHVPASWEGVWVAAQVRIDGLPQQVTGGLLVDADVVAWSDAATSRLPADDACCLPMRVSLRMNVPGSQDMPRAGQRWQVWMRLHEPDGLSNPGGFDATLAYFERGVRAVAQSNDKAGRAPQLLSDGAVPAWSGWIDRWRQSVRERIQTHVQDARTAGVLAGLSIGDQSAIERDDWTVFQRTGVAHLVSISGAHIAMFGWMAAALVRRLWTRWSWGVHQWPASDVARWTAVGASALYALVSGWGVPAQRTVWMMLIVAMLRGRGRLWPWPLTWAISAWILTVLDPWAIRQVGFWLSYVAVGVLMSSDMGRDLPARGRPANPGEARPSWLNRAWSSFLDMARVQALVTLALTPLSLVCFQQTSLVSFFANLVAIPVFTALVTPLALAGALWHPLWALGAVALQAMMQVLSAMANWPMAMWSAPALPWWAQVLVVVAGVAQIWVVPWRWRVTTWPLLILLIYLPHGLRSLPPPVRGRFELLAADVGQGSAIFIRTSSHTLLFDTGPRIGTQSNAGDRTLLPLMRSLGISRLDMLMISHQDSDHVGGASAIVQQAPVQELRSSLAADHALRQQPGVSGHPVPHVACLAGQHWQWDGVDFDVLHPTAQEYRRRDIDHADIETNAMSCVLRVSTRSGSALLTGDIGEDQERDIVLRAEAIEGGTAALRSTVLLAPHHGSHTSSSELFLRAISPRLIAIQVGRRNRYGHPAPDVLARYRQMGLLWVDSPHCGAYIWVSDPGQTKGTCWRDAHGHYWQG